MFGADRVPNRFSRRVLLSDAQGRKQKPNRRPRCLGIAPVSEERKKRKQESDSKGVLFSLDFRGHIEVMLVYIW